MPATSQSDPANGSPPLSQHRSILSQGVSVSPGAGPPLSINQNKAFTVTRQKHSTAWEAPGVEIDNSRYPMPPTVSPTGSWKYDDIIPFCSTGGTCNVRYTVNLSITPMGDISGSDSNDCVFSGTIQPASNGLHPLTIRTNNCGATNQFIIDATFDGFAYFDAAANNQPDTLRLVVVNLPQKAAIGMSLGRQ